MRYNKHKAYLLIAYLIASSLYAAYAFDNNKNYFNDTERGWFWGEINSQEDEEKKEEPKKQPKNENNIVFDGKEYKTIPSKASIPWSILDKLHPDEIANLETQTKNISVMYPTQENVLEYKKLQHFISNKAMGFTDTNYFVAKQDPEISNWASQTSMNSRLVISAKRNDLWEKQKNVIFEHSKNMIILVATLPTCPFCKQQMPLLKDFENEFGIEFKEVDISTNKEFAINYQVQKTPDLFLLYRDKNNEPLLTRFGNGLHTIQDLKQGVLASLFTFKKIPQDYLEY
ncbi:conjugal transfer protein TraF [Arcobacter butzleri]|uniref:conjugal transfer protein TraF n=1 Tax=Aliarcobacter butzleri TaxID=28197 RepID=UPI001587DECC|nr:conjugal transfer protein TraF [Aliarcobacter butzleri]MCG3686470.1 conjugal transfer protein TraF [Aliarcobacter butzleri]MCG3711519.1 conjugal transfer protein TraF [Aliarcobacter butzleri]MCG3713970.1 conjugal transfer protein TraF [Aliarcobacter butzleri]NUW25086.1 conjugal transfer protein TraF [Aliarcobacter butzleri]